MERRTRSGGARVLIGGTGYSIKGGRTLVGGTGYSISFGTPVSSLAVGSSVYMNVNGVRTEFLVVHQGLPGSMYDSSCNGTWVLPKSTISGVPNLKWDSGSYAQYADSKINTYLSTTFIGMLDSKVQNVVSQANIITTNTSDRYGAPETITVSTKAFLISLTEMGVTNKYVKVLGSKLSYFKDGEGSSAVGKRTWNLAYWTRSCNTNYRNIVYYCDSGGSYSSDNPNSTVLGVRPIMILSSKATVDENFNIAG